MASAKKNVIVVGAGFAGVNCVRELADVDCNVAVFDRHNYHLFQPLLYQVATAGLSPADIAYPIRRIFRDQMNVQVVLGEIDSIDLKARMISMQGHAQDFDYLMIAAGATHSYRGKDDWAKLAPGLKTIDDALEIRRRILLSFEEAEDEMDEASRRAKLTFVIIGGGPTGVELAGALREIAAKDIPRDFRNVDTTTARVILVQGGDRLLPAFDPGLSERAKIDLESLGVEVRLKARVTDINESGLKIGDEQIDTPNVFWAAGVQAPAFTATLGVELDASGRVKVLPDLSVPGFANVFVAGDLACVVDPQTGNLVPGVAPAAMQMGRHVGRVLRDELVNGPRVASQRPAFDYTDKGSMATIGKARAVADIRGYRFHGFAAWCLWCVIHVLFLIGFRSKLLVLISWVWSYLFSRRAVRLITGATRLRVRALRDVTPNTSVSDRR
jgi:NADH:ubiquinone reductase (H+-translocating)